MLSKRGVASIAAFILCCNTVLTPASALTYKSFSDVPPNSWYETSVNRLNEAGYMPCGYGSNFEPGKVVTVGEFSYVVLKCDNAWVRSPAKNETWVTPYLEEVANRLGNQIPDGELTRAKAVEIAVAVLGIPLATNETSPFADTNDVYAITAASAGLVGGISRQGKTYFDGDSLLTRAQMTAMGSKMMDFCIAKRIEGKGSSFKSKLYENISNIGLCIDADTPAPNEPSTIQDFRQALEYMMVHELSEYSFTYLTGNIATIKANALKNLTDAVRSFRYERSEYFSYFLKVGMRTKGNQDGSCTLTIVLQTPEYNLDTLLDCRAAAFKAASSKLQSLYESGKLNSGMTETERARIITELISETTQYKDNGDRLDHTAWSVFERHTAVCDGYSSALQLMLSLDNIRCWGQYGRIKKNNEPHQWVMAVLDGNVLGIDPTLYSVRAQSYFGMDEKTVGNIYQIIS